MPEHRVLRAVKLVAMAVLACSAEDIAAQAQPPMVRVEVNRRDVTTQYRRGYRLAPSIHDEDEFRAEAAEYRLAEGLAQLADTLTETRLRQHGFGSASSSTSRWYWIPEARRSAS